VVPGEPPPKPAPRDVPPPDFEDGGAAETGPLAADAIEKVNAGAQLTYALYHRDADWWKDQPDSVVRAYMRACTAYGVGGGS